jgi:AcrR family transcriptional regulator
MMHKAAQNQGIGNMPPKFKFSKNELIDTAFDLVRKNGWSALTTRSLADELGTSARPIYSHFNSMEELEEEIAKKGVDLLYRYMIQERTGDPWHDHGIGYVMFAQDEKRLFLGMNDEKHIKYYKAYGEVIWDTLTESLADYLPFKGLSEEQIYQVQLTRWLMSHGLAFQVANHPPEVWEEKITITMQQGSIAILEGLKQQFALKIETIL